jgi:hypothetical protein
MKTPEEKEELRIRPRETETVSLRVPKDVLASLGVLAQEREMSVEALLKLYVGQGLRQDLSRRFSERMLTTAEEVLSRHLESPEEVTTILQEIRDGAHQPSVH